MRKTLMALSLAVAMNANAATLGILTTKEEVMQLPASGPGWDALVEHADLVVEPFIGHSGSLADSSAAASAMVWLRTGDTTYRDKALAAIQAVIGTEVEDGHENTALAFGRNLAGWIAAADLIDLATLDPDTDALFRPWIEMFREYRPPNSQGSDRSMIQGAERRCNDWGSEPLKSLVSIALYLENQAHLDHAIGVLKARLGETDDLDSLEWNADTSWKQDPDKVNHPIYNSEGARHPVSGEPIGGVNTDGMRMSGSFIWPPVQSSNAYGTAIGEVEAVYYLERTGYNASAWGNRAIFRWAEWLNTTIFANGETHAVDQSSSSSSGTCAPWIVNHLYPNSQQWPNLPMGECGATRSIHGFDWLLGGMQ